MHVYDPIPFADFVERSDAEMSARAAAFYDLMRTRHSCRAFDSAPVPDDVIEACVRTAGTAPSGANHQPWHFAIVRSPEVKSQIRRGAEEEERAFYREKASAEWLEALAPLGTDDAKPYLETAPVLIVVFGQRRGGAVPSENRLNYYVSESVGIATGFLLAALHHAGLATLTHTPAPMRFLNAICGRPASEKPMLIVVAGKPAADATMPRHATLKRPLRAIASWA
jgi:iodotyrosine deiodinase